MKKVLILLALLCSVVYSKNVKIAVMDFEYMSQDFNYRYLQKAIPALITSNLVRSENIEVIEKAKLTNAVKSLNLPYNEAVNGGTERQAGKIVGANSVILGSVVLRGKQYQIDCKLLDVKTGKIITSDQITCYDEEEIISKVDFLSYKIIKILTGEQRSLTITKPQENLAEKNGKTLAFETFMDNTYRLNGDDNYHYVQVDIYSKKIKKNKRLPLNISLVIDKSGSMSGDKIENVKKAAEFVVNNCSNDDIYSIVTYSSYVQSLIPAKKANNRERDISAIRNIRADGGTNLSGGLFAGFDEVEKNFKSGRVNRVLLLSDGIANQGITDPNTLTQRASNLASDGISISTFGVGANYNEVLMAKLSQAGNGQYHFISSANQVAEIFSKEINGLFSVAAQDLNITIDTEDGTELVEVIGKRVIKEGNSSTIKLGDFYGEQVKSVIIKLRVPKSHKGGKYKCAKIYYSYADATDKGEIYQTSKELILKYTDKEKKVKKYRNIKLSEYALSENSSNTITEAIALIRNGNTSVAENNLKEEQSKLMDISKEMNSKAVKTQILQVEKNLYLAENFEAMKQEEQKLQVKRAHEQRLTKKAQYQSLNQEAKQKASEQYEELKMMEEELQRLERE